MESEPAALYDIPNGYILAKLVLNRDSLTGDLSVITQHDPERGGDSGFEAILVGRMWPVLAKFLQEMSFGAPRFVGVSAFGSRIQARLFYGCSPAKDHGLGTVQRAECPT